MARRTGGREYEKKQNKKEQTDGMIIPIRCYSCGKVIADKWREFQRRTDGGKKSASQAMDELGMVRYCCRRMFLGQLDLLDKL